VQGGSEAENEAKRRKRIHEAEPFPPELFTAIKNYKNAAPGETSQPLAKSSTTPTLQVKTAAFTLTSRQGYSPDPSQISGTRRYK
jgi:hypothetical protein